MLRELKSVQNPYVKLLTSLTNKRNIEKNGFTFLEGEKVVKDILEKPVSVKAVLVEPQNKELLELCPPGVSQYLISPDVSKKISQMITPSKAFAVVELPKEKQFSVTTPFLVLDHMQDPSNLGAIVRSALAFGYNQIVLIESTYPYTPKAIRASMGYVFDVNCIQFSRQKFVEFAKENKLHLIGASMNGKSVDALSKPVANFGLVIGNEGKGISQEVQSVCTQFVSIPMQAGVESLNATVSASILMHALLK